MHGWFLRSLFELYQKARTVGGRIEIDGIWRLKEQARRAGRSAIAHRSGHHASVRTQEEELPAIATPSRTTPAIAGDAARHPAFQRTHVDFGAAGRIRVVRHPAAIGREARRP